MRCITFNESKKYITLEVFYLKRKPFKPTADLINRGKASNKRNVISQLAYGF